MMAFFIGSVIAVLFTIVWLLDDIKKRLDEIIEIMNGEEKWRL